MQNEDMKTLLFALTLSLLPATSYAQPKTDTDICMEELGTWEFGDKRLKLAQKKIVSPIALVWQKKFIKWNGYEISEWTRSNEIEAMSLQPSEKKIRSIWNQEKGRIDKSFPSEDLKKIKEELVAQSFYSLQKVKTTPENHVRLAEIYKVCEPLKSIKALRTKKSVGEIASEKLKELESEFPKANKPRAPKNGSAQ